jgi:hypothetical protein
MKNQIIKLKTELMEFLELSKTITQGRWEQVEDCVDRGGNHKALIAIFGRQAGITREQDERDAAFIAQSRNISPAMAECLLNQIEWLEQYAIPVESANQQLQQILNIWEAAK